MVRVSHQQGQTFTALAPQNPENIAFNAIAKATYKSVVQLEISQLNKRVDKHCMSITEIDSVVQEHSSSKKPRSAWELASFEFLDADKQHVVYTPRSASCWDKLSFVLKEKTQKTGSSSAQPGTAGAARLRPRPASPTMLLLERQTLRAHPLRQLRPHQRLRRQRRLLKSLQGLQPQPTPTQHQLRPARQPLTRSQHLSPQPALRQLPPARRHLRPTVVAVSRRHRQPTSPWSNVATASAKKMISLLKCSSRQPPQPQRQNIGAGSKLATLTKPTSASHTIWARLDGLRQHTDRLEDDDISTAYSEVGAPGITGSWLAYGLQNGLPDKAIKRPVVRRQVEWNDKCQK